MTYRIFLSDGTLIEVPWLDTMIVTIVDEHLVVESSNHGTSLRRIAAFLAGEWDRVELVKS